MRLAISRAALLVKVTTSRREAASLSISILWNTEAVSVEVLPVPAPARTKAEPGRIAASRESFPGVRDNVGRRVGHHGLPLRPIVRTIGDIKEVFEGAGHGHGSALSCRTAVAWRSRSRCRNIDSARQGGHGSHGSSPGMGRGSSSRGWQRIPSASRVSSRLQPTM